MWVMVSEDPSTCQVLSWETDIGHIPRLDDPDVQRGRSNCADPRESTGS